jgi:nitrate reductase NapAB chaperone NapD
MQGKIIKKPSDKKSKIKLNLSDIYNIEIPIVSAKGQQEIDKLSLEASEYLKKSINKMNSIERIIGVY